MSDFAKNESFDEREEGEIVDDFEEISDYSIQSPSLSGKSVSLQDLLQDVSLSSISNTGDNEICVYNNIPDDKQIRRKRRRKYGEERRSKRRKKSGEHYAKTNHKKIHHRRKESSSESNSDKLDYHTLKLLKNSIRINAPHEAERKSLRMRLQAMSQLNPVHSQTEKEEETLRMLALLSNTKIDQGANNLKSSSKEDVIEILEVNKNNVENEFLDDEELIELRLAALKSAVMKKATERKKRKEQHKLNTNEINKENVVNKENNETFPIQNNHDAISDTGTDIKETKNITPATANDEVNTHTELLDNNILKSSSEIKNVSMEEDVDIMRAMLLASMSKRITSNSVQHMVIPVKKNVETKENFLSRKNVVMKQQNVFKNSNLPNVKPLIINLNDSDSDTDTLEKKNKNPNDILNKDKNWTDSVTQFLKQQRAAVEAKSVIQNHLNKELLLDKSVVKLLPKSQQREYQFLKQKLLAEKKKRLRKVINKTIVKNVTTKKLVKVKLQNAGANSYINRSQQEVNLHGLQKTLDDMQMQKNGRLQMKGKYKELTPLLRNVNETTAERKKCEMEIKKLLEDLKKTRNKLTTVSQQFTNLVKRLMNEKEAIDRRPIKRINNEAQPILFNAKDTSTPVKNTQVAVSDNIYIKDLSSIGSNVDDNLDVCPKAAENNVDTDLPVKKYVSPLDIKNRDDAVKDPLATFCPYELFGVCKDPECTFSHYSKT